MAQSVKKLPAVQETQVLSLGQEDPLEKEMATHSSTLTCTFQVGTFPSYILSSASPRGSSLTALAVPMLYP